MSATVIVDLALSAATVLALGALALRLHHGQRTLMTAGNELRRSEHRFRRLAECSPLGIFELDRLGKRVYANPKLHEITGAAGTPSLPEQILSAPWHVSTNVVAAGDDAASMAHTGHWHIRRGDGEMRWVRLDAAPLVQDGELSGWIGSVTDITEEHELAERHERLSEVLEVTPDLVAVIDVNGRVSYLNQAARAALAFGDTDHLGSTSILRAYAPGSRETFIREILPIALRDGVWTGEVSLRRHDHTDLPVSQVVVAHRRADGTVDYLSCVSRDISERRDFEARLVYQGLHDALTGLPNRVLFSDRLDQALARANRHGPAGLPATAGTVAVFLLDLDHFKLVNDSSGHEVGDQLLIHAARRISSALRTGDTVARFGGDEFAVLCEEVSGAAHAREIAEAISDQLAMPFELAESVSDADVTSREPLRVFLTASIGIAMPNESTSSAEALLRDADAALNRAKADGRARQMLFVEDYRHSAVLRMRTANDLHQALSEQEFRVVYQPEVSLVDGHIVAVEALVRWHHPERGLIPPAEFIPLAEETGIVLPIGAWVLDEVIAQAREWSLRLPGLQLVTWVNLSARQLAQGDLVDMIAGGLARHDVPAESLGLEITESALLEDAEHAIATLTALRELGVRLAVDDFGTGYSSLAYLRQLPVEQLKVDRTFVDGLGSNREASAIVAAVIGLARDLGLTTVAEGVESASQVEALRQLCCDLAQGYYFATPQPALTIGRLLEASERGPLFAPLDLAPVLARVPSGDGNPGTGAAHVPAPRTSP